MLSGGRTVIPPFSFVQISLKSSVGPLYDCLPLGVMGYTGFVRNMKLLAELSKTSTGIGWSVVRFERFRDPHVGKSLQTVAFNIP